MAKIIFPAIRYVPKNKKEEEKYIEFLVNLYRKTYDFTLPFCDTLTDTKTIEGLPLSEAKQVFLVMISDLYKADKISSYSKKCLICDVATDLVDSDVKNASLGRISEIINLGTTYLSAVYTEINRSSFKDYLISAKMNLAKNLIRETQMDINSVSAAVGYSDVKYFRRLFRNNTGLIPAEYRKKESSEN